MKKWIILIIFLIATNCEAGYLRDDYRAELFRRQWSRDGVEEVEINGNAMMITINQALHTRLRDEKYFRDAALSQWIRFARRNGKEGIIAIYYKGYEVLVLEFDVHKWRWKAKWVRKIYE